jgi:hypothetical protein
MKRCYSLVGLIAILVFFSCSNGGGSKNSNEDSSALQGDTSVKPLVETLPGKILTPKEVVKYTAVATKSDTSALDQLKTTVDCSDVQAALLKMKLKDLNSGAGFEYYKFTSDQSASASFMGFSGSFAKNDLVVIQDYVKYVFLTCGGVKKRYGVGLRCFIHINTTNTKITGSLAAVAANVQLGKANATFELKSLGFAVGGDVIANGLSGQSDYNVDDFAKILVTYTNVLKTLTDSNTTLSMNPVELP